MTSRERFDAHLAETETDYLTKAEADNAFIFWQAAERDMLERAIAVLTRYNDCSDAYEEIKELLND